MTRRLLAAVFACLLASLAVAAPSANAGRRPANPSVGSVSPIRVKVGRTLVISGRYFSRRPSSNTVIFRGVAGRLVFLKPYRTSAGRLYVSLPSRMQRLMRGGAIPQPTRMRLRVAVARRYGAYTPLGISPVIYPLSTSGGGPAPTPEPDCDGDGSANSQDSDDDNDLLPDTLEVSLKTDPCLRDTDGDGVEDGFEYQSALRLNRFSVSDSVPYPGKRPYPNPLDATDAHTDYDGDSLSQREEFELWMRWSSDGAKRVGRPTDLNLTYSDGTQRTRLDSTDDAIARDSLRLPGVDSALIRWSLDKDGNGVLADDERDGDGDGLSNFDEAHGPMTAGWWTAVYKSEKSYPGLTYLDGEHLSAGAPPAYADDDIDGDGVRDGADDQDHDGLNNMFEVRRPDDWATTYVSTGHNYPMAPDGVTPNPWARVQPFNPCKPLYSARCHLHPPVDYYGSEDWASPYGYYPDDPDWPTSSPAYPGEISPDTPPTTPAG